ncbi:hypothetical protein [Pedobacter sp. R-06]|uniref:hypothetical protein n=1 Tax=Pedobacter sp. R-06 TaxID=3404051 RepID=UPI003CF008E4
MKNLISILTIFILLITACKAQQPIAKISEGKIKVSGETFNVKKDNNKLTVIRNVTNKLSDVEQYAPHLPQEARVNYHMTVDKKLLTKICADAIPLSTLRKLPIGANGFLLLISKVNPLGAILEIKFVLESNSLLTLNELQEIEEKLKSAQFKIKFDKEIQHYIKDANYFPIDLYVSYADMLKAKEGN